MGDSGNDSAGAGGDAPPKRGRGRPRKTPKPDTVEVAAKDVSGPKRSRGRPKKATVEAAKPAPKATKASPVKKSTGRGRGRPKKQPQPESSEDDAEDATENASTEED